ncbi:hypothetical protein WU86_01080 [Corynebacterium xerosis]|nr:hypothetical protein WU86_01080 [Corynebacterium xerosis]
MAPRREYQALPGLRKFARELAAIVERIEPISTPPDEDEPKDSKEPEATPSIPSAPAIMAS